MFKFCASVTNSSREVYSVWKTSIYIPNYESLKRGGKANFHSKKIDLLYASILK